MFVSVVTVRGIVAELRALGIDPAPIFRHAEVTEDQLHLLNMLPIVQYSAIVTAAMELTRDPGLGLTLASHAPASMYQVVSYLICSVPTLLDAISVIERYGGLLIAGLQVSLQRKREIAEFQFDFQLPPADHILRFGAECFSSSAVRMARSVFAPTLALSAVGFRYPEPSYGERYRAVFDCPVLFGQATNFVAFPAAALEARQPHADATMVDVLGRVADELLRDPGYRTTLKEQARTLLSSEPDLCSVDTQLLARRLGLSHRVLRRRLSLEGITLSALVEEARMDSARRELKRPGITIKEAAERLGYSEPSAFHRAFKRWTGTTPAEFRRDAQP